MSKKNGPIRSFMNGMFDNIGGRIQFLAEILCWVGIGASIIIGIVVSVITIKDEVASNKKTVVTYTETTVSSRINPDEVREKMKTAIGKFFGDDTIDESSPNSEPIIGQDWWNNPPADTNWYHYEVGYGKGANVEESRLWADVNVINALEQYVDNCAHAVSFVFLNDYNSISDKNAIEKEVSLFETEVKVLAQDALSGVRFEYKEDENGGVYALAELPVNDVSNLMLSCAESMASNIEANYLMQDAVKEAFSRSDSTAVAEANALINAAIDKYFGTSDSSGTTSSSSNNASELKGEESLALSDSTAKAEANEKMNAAIEKYFGTSTRSASDVIAEVFAIVFCVIFGILIMIIGSIISWVLSWFMHGFGELIENSSALVKLKEIEYVKSGRSVFDTPEPDDLNDWWDNPPENTSETLYVVRSGKTNTLQESQKKAEDYVLSVFWQYLRIAIKAIVTTFKSEAGDVAKEKKNAKAIRMFTSQSDSDLFNGAQYRYHLMDDGTVYVFMELSVATLVENLKSEVDELPATEEARGILKDVIDKYFKA